MRSKNTVVRVQCASENAFIENVKNKIKKEAYISVCVFSLLKYIYILLGGYILFGLIKQGLKPLQLYTQQELNMLFMGIEP